MVRLRGKFYDYQFIKNGKRYSGVCEGCTTKKDAEAYEKKKREDLLKDGEEIEKKVRETMKTGATQKTVRALVENFREELTGGRKIPLSDAFTLSMQKPRKRVPSEKVLSRKREAFQDFVDFMAETFPDAEDIAGVLPKHAEAYMARLRTSGRFHNTVTYQRAGKTLSRPSTASISNKTINDIQMICREVFSLLSRDAGLIDNPFDLKKLQKEETGREAFSDEEICLIRDHLDPFTRPLFTIAMMTALREGDICTLKWTDIDFREMVIRKKMNKTRRIVEIPLAGDLAAYLQSLRKEDAGEYVLPAHAKMYLENPTGVSYRVKQFLEGIGIQTTRTPDGRERAVSVKDLHSCRHTFCYYAGIRGIPLSVVQSIVGHMSPEMTKHYSAHATLEEKRKNMSLMADFMGRTVLLPETPAEAERAELRSLADTLPIEKVREILNTLKYNTKEEA